MRKSKDEETTSVETRLSSELCKQNCRVQIHSGQPAQVLKYSPVENQFFKSFFLSASILTFYNVFQLINLFPIYFNSKKQIDKFEVIRISLLL